MISYYLGIPGSGKSYAGINIIYNNFTDNKDAKKDLKKGYLSAYTNINEFKFDLCKNVYHLDFDLLLEQITELYNMVNVKKSGRRLKREEDEPKKATDKELIEKAKEFNIYKTLFVIDECHNFFDSQNKVLIWWLTYHRHLYHDIILITQNLALVNLKYKPLAEAFYKAKSSSLTLNKRFFNYMYYTDSRMSRASYVNTVKVLKRKSVFELYHSGDVVEGKNVILRFLYISLFMLFVLFAFGYYYFHKNRKDTINSSVEKVEKKSGEKSISSDIHKINSTDKNIKDVEDNDFDKSSIVLVKITCTSKMCNYKNQYFDIKVLAFSKKTFYFHTISSVISFNSVVLYCAVDQDFINFITGGVNNDTQAISSPVNMFSNIQK